MILDSEPSSLFVLCFSGVVGGEVWDLAFEGVGFVPGFVEMWVRSRLYFELLDSTKEVTAGKGSGGLA